MAHLVRCFLFFFCFNDTATTEIYTYGHTLSLHDALPILRQALIHNSAWRGYSYASISGQCAARPSQSAPGLDVRWPARCVSGPWATWSRGKPRRLFSGTAGRSEEHTSELQSLIRISYAVFCLKKNTQQQSLMDCYEEPRCL